LVKKAYRTKAKEAHPDRGGDAEEVLKSRNYHILSLKI
jgi:curved DNA-binding protein CbpA